MTQSDGEHFRRMLGKKIKALRTGRGITQVELARALGFTSTGTISQVENGLRGLKFESIVKAGKTLNVHPLLLMMPEDMDEEDFEMISAMLKLFEKRSERPDQMCPQIEEVRKILRGTIHNSRHLESDQMD